MEEKTISNKQSSSLEQSEILRLLISKIKSNIIITNLKKYTNQYKQSLNGNLSFIELLEYSFLHLLKEDLYSNPKFLAAIESKLCHKYNKLLLINVLSKRVHDDHSYIYRECIAAIKQVLKEQLLFVKPFFSIKFKKLSDDFIASFERHKQNKLSNKIFKISEEDDDDENENNDNFKNKPLGNVKDITFKSQTVNNKDSSKVKVSVPSFNIDIPSENKKPRHLRTKQTMVKPRQNEANEKLNNMLNQFRKNKMNDQSCNPEIDEDEIPINNDFSIKKNSFNSVKSPIEKWKDEISFDVNNDDELMFDHLLDNIQEKKQNHHEINKGKYTQHLIKDHSPKKQYQNDKDEKKIQSMKEKSFDEQVLEISKNIPQVNVTESRPYRTNLASKIQSEERQDQSQDIQYQSENANDQSPDRQELSQERTQLSQDQPPEINSFKDTVLKDLQSFQSNDSVQTNSNTKPNNIYSSKTNENLSFFVRDYKSPLNKSMDINSPDYDVKTSKLYPQIFMKKYNSYASLLDKKQEKRSPNVFMHSSSVKNLMAKLEPLNNSLIEPVEQPSRQQVRQKKQSKRHPRTVKASMSLGSLLDNNTALSESEEITSDHMRNSSQLNIQAKNNSTHIQNRNETLNNIEDKNEGVLNQRNRNFFKFNTLLKGKEDIKDKMCSQIKRNTISKSSKLLIINMKQAHLNTSVDLRLMI